ncbi:prenylated rab acceptor 1 [Niveomyces insectorum RCEF 264]|uniref:Prenylated rab acceptor 1 n=1 Tax=Niveomyces insectorum RCEF 264 TaxID=1081102 RepID=A0A162MCZ6_9HYPO|nr:prenylated rab acceptor 1 [Niveomyces insectorum RCEF 264]
MAGRIQIPLDMLTSRFQLGDRFNSVRSTSLATRFSNLRPLSEFFDVKRLSKPQNFADMQSRVNYNLGHFSSNYAVVFVMLCIYTLLTNWWLLFDIVFVASGMFLIGKLDGRDLEIGTFRATTSQLYTGLPSWGRASSSAAASTTIGTATATNNRRRGKRTGRNSDIFSGNNGNGEGFWNAALGGGGSRVVEELESSSSLSSGDDDSQEEDGKFDDEDDSLGVSEPGEEERVVLESARARVRRAQAKGKTQVSLSRAELAAFGRQRERELRAEQRQQQRREQRERIAVPIAQLDVVTRRRGTLPASAASGLANSNRDDDDNDVDNRAPQRIPGSFHQHEERQVYPPIGYFPPPGATTRTPLPTSNSQPSLRNNDGGVGGTLDTESRRSGSPFAYSYVRSGVTPSTSSATRHSSYPATATTASPYVDPFQYLTTDPRARLYPSSSVAARPRRPETTEFARGSAAADAAAAARGRHGAPRRAPKSSEDDDSTASENSRDNNEDDRGEDKDDGTYRPAVHNTRSRTKQTTADTSGSSRRRNEIVVEVDSDSESELEPEPQSAPAPLAAPRPAPVPRLERARSSKTKKSTRRSSPSPAKAKRKSTGGSTSSPSLHASRRRKGK